VTRLTGYTLFAISLAYAQGDFSTAGSDAHRSSWVRTDPKINPASMQKPGFEFLWKVKTGSASLTPAPLMARYIGYRGFREFAFIAGNSDKAFAFDTGLGRIEWQKSLAASSTPCGMTANLARAVVTAFPGTGGRGGAGGGGRAIYAKSAVSEPDEGAVTLKEAQARLAAAAANAGRRGPAPGRGPALPSIFAPHREYVYAISSDGMLHSLLVSNGEEPDAPIQFVPANSNAMGLTVVNNVAYVVSSSTCGGWVDTVWAVDLASKEVTSWKGLVVGSAGAAFGPDGTLYAATRGGELAALEAKTLKLRDVYKASTAFATSPIVFQYQDATMLATTTADKRIHLFDIAKLAAGPAFSAPIGGASELATWQDAAGARYILAANQTSLTAQRFKDGAFEQAWSRNFVATITPLIVNGVVFTASRGNPTMPAVLFALDAASGAPLWNSGKTITSFVQSGGISAVGGQVFLGTQDGTLYAFGFPIEH
jgi:outer membrane protein assembly factor BamB